MGGKMGKKRKIAENGRENGVKVVNKKENWTPAEELSDRRHNLTQDNMEKYLVIMQKAKFLWKFVILSEMSFFLKSFSINAE